MLLFTKILATVRYVNSSLGYFSLQQREANPTPRYENDRLLLKIPPKTLWLLHPAAENLLTFNGWKKTVKLILIRVVAWQRMERTKKTGDMMTIVRISLHFCFIASKEYFPLQLAAIWQWLRFYCGCLGLMMEDLIGSFFLFMAPKTIRPGRGGPGNSRDIVRVRAIMENCYHMLLSVSVKVKRTHWDTRSPPLLSPLPPGGARMSADQHVSGSRVEPAHCPAHNRRSPKLKRCGRAWIGAVQVANQEKATRTYWADVCKWIKHYTETVAKIQPSYADSGQSSLLVGLHEGLVWCNFWMIIKLHAVCFLLNFKRPGV